MQSTSKQRNFLKKFVFFYIILNRTNSCIKIIQKKNAQLNLVNKLSIDHWKSGGKFLKRCQHSHGVTVRHPPTPATQTLRTITLPASRAFLTRQNVRMCTFRGKMSGATSSWSVRSLKWAQARAESYAYHTVRGDVPLHPFLPVLGNTLIGFHVTRWLTQKYIGNALWKLWIV